jgi:phosphoglycolate phosphatase-like HAD superfamily hydrolase
MSLAARAVFFDFDGVIADSVDVKTQAFVALYTDHGPEIMAKVESYHLANLGRTRFEKIAHFQREFVAGAADDGTVGELAARFGLEVKQRVIAAPEIPGARRALEELSGRLPLFLISATPDEELLDILAARGIAHLFTSAHGSGRSKPEILADLLSTHRLEPRACVMVGDAMTDYHAAQKHGVRFVGLVSPERPNPFPPGTMTMPDLTGFAAHCLADQAA